MVLKEIKAIVILAKMSDGKTRQILVRKDLVDHILSIMLFNGGINILQEQLNIELDEI
jgi:hypothetical protein